MLRHSSRATLRILFFHPQSNGNHSDFSTETVLRREIHFPELIQTVVRRTGLDEESTSEAPADVAARGDGSSGWDSNNGNRDGWAESSEMEKVKSKDLE